eukprot:CAMPEP_0201741880 /NCGR_PEP_ID=MMETSP0593-20130828/47036_1 /ASSEMBLY_ACC=CAM_ASM_000672 /TAXON_ID=267983 /ORGANISM="Skeletonema japonicum, Strain CCMP2506" /LENGTH=402 /DNA_ID=CAMNT_0048236219 /DNA_START=24 /DNA_END=1232 /DNA_ORIENTATION=+
MAKATDEMNKMKAKLRRRRSRVSGLSSSSCAVVRSSSIAAFLWIVAFSLKPSDAFAPPTILQSPRCQYHVGNGISTKLHAVTNLATETPLLADYAPAAATLFNNMKLPAAVVTAGMISLGFATRFPELPRDTLEKVYPQSLRARCAKLERLHIVLGLVSVTSELIVVLWAAVAVNQLTERVYEPAVSVWDLIHRDCDLAWSAVNSHYILGIIGFTGMLWLRAYVMLLAASASKSLVNAASTGTAAATCLMVSIVNRGVESGGGTSVDRYGNTILDLFTHYAALLLKVATDEASPGPLQLSAMVLEIASLCFMFHVLITESDAKFEEQLTDEHSCPVDAYDVLRDDNEVSKLTKIEVEKLKTCVDLGEEEDKRQRIREWVLDGEDEREEVDDSGDYSSVNVSA